MQSRRFFLGASGAALGAAMVPGLALARVASDRRFVFILLRGGMDGIGAVAPYGDPVYAAARGPLAQSASLELRLDDLFALHPKLATTAELYRNGEALIVHATATSYRDRSHFDGQNVLETGGLAPHLLSDGWINRLLGQLPGGRSLGIAMSAAPPLIVQGSVPVVTNAPSGMPAVNADLIARLGNIYSGDPLLHPLWEQATLARSVTATAGAGGNLPGLARLAGGFLTQADGPRIAVIESGGWDTHAEQQFRLGFYLGELDAALAALKTSLGPTWADTVVVAATEFGRTVSLNGTGGTDHGTASAAFVAGGAVRGGRVLADWPGLASKALQDGRDLRPTSDLRELLLGLLAAHFSEDPRRLAAVLFPGASGLRPVDGLLRTRI